MRIEGRHPANRDARRLPTPFGQLLRHARLWPLDQDTTRLYGTVFNELRRQGRALSQVDIMLAALARQHKLVILSSDADFDVLPDIKRENWTQ
jgi:tRNA(fMet)-specific endonuclease VapC